MEGAHDLGGVGGFGRVRHEDQHTHTEDWELRAQLLALRACRGARPWVERIDPGTYLTTSYYGRWLLAGEMGAIANGIVTQAELDGWRASIEADGPPPRVDDAERRAVVEGFMTTPQPMEAASTCRFAVGDPVQAIRIYAPDVHHKVPRYIRGVPGVVESVQGLERLAGYRGYDRFEPVYTVEYRSTDVWGASTAEPPYAIFVDLWESYLEPA
jgi:nitrile hydratase subunit beta